MQFLSKFYSTYINHICVYIYIYFIYLYLYTESFQKSQILSWFPCIKFFGLLPAALIFKPQIPTMYNLTFSVLKSTFTYHCIFTLSFGQSSVLCMYNFGFHNTLLFYFLLCPWFSPAAGIACDILFEYDIFSA